MSCRLLQCSELWAVPFSQEELEGSGSRRSLQHRRTLNYSVISSQLQGSGVCFPVQRHHQWHRRGQDMNSFALFHMTAHSSEGTAGLYSSNHGRPYRTMTKPVPTFPLWILGKGTTGKTSWPVHNQTMLVTCVWAESESLEAPAVPFFMLWIHIPIKVALLELTLGAQNSCTEDISCDLGKKGFLKS